MLRLPGLIDPHVHFREPGGVYKEDWDSGTSAALAGGFTTVLAMPNTKPPITDLDSFNAGLDAAKRKARCDYALFIGAGPDNLKWIRHAARRAAGLKMYLDQTYGPLRLDDMSLWMEHFKSWPRHRPIVAHAEGRSMAAIILMAAIYRRTLHIAHVSLREEIMLIKTAKEKGIKVTCEVAPHHLFLTSADIPLIGAGRSEVRPRLASFEDQNALWNNLDVIDVFATDHAPHTLQEKDGQNPPPGFPGLETALPLLLGAVRAGRLSIEDLINKMVVNPRRIFSIPEQLDTWVEVDTEARWEIHGSEQFTRCQWTPFEGWKVTGKVSLVTLGGRVAFKQGQVIAPMGFGRNIRHSRLEN